MGNKHSARSGAVAIEGIPDGFELVAMAVHNDTVIVCTTNGVYRLTDGVFKPIKFELVDGRHD